MRKIYILSREEDGRVGEVILDQGLDPDSQENPVCPRCGSETLLAYAEGDEYSVLTWFCLTEEEESAAPDAWYLICQDFYCPYEERVERVHDPGEAEFFDLDQSHWVLDEETGLTGSHPAGLKELIAYLEAVQETHPHRKLDAFLSEARWRYDDCMERTRRWIQRIPPGRKISLGVSSEHIKARFITATGERLLIETVPQGEMVGISVEEIASFGPLHFDTEQEEPSESNGPPRPDRLIRLFAHHEYIVVRSCHLRLWEVDRFGLFRVTSSDPAAAGALGLTKESEGHWRGHFGRREIEARYEKKRVVRAKGYWFDVYGETSHSRSPAVITEDPAAAAALGLEVLKGRPGYEEDPGPGIQRWGGVIPRDQVEEWDEVSVYLWPIPELKDAGGGGSDV